VKKPRHLSQLYSFAVPKLLSKSKCLETSNQVSFDTFFHGVKSNLWRFWYLCLIVPYGGYDGNVWRIGHVRTQDFRTFEPNPHNPVFTPSANRDAWDCDGVLTPQIIEIGDTYSRATQGILYEIMEDETMKSVQEKPEVLMLVTGGLFDEVFRRETLEKLHSFAQVIVPAEKGVAWEACLPTAEGIITSWGQYPRHGSG
jgi:hypothetical protein